MMKSVLTGMALACAAACAGAQSAAPVASETRDAEFVELGLDEFSSPFTKKTVLKLNAIVAKSLETIRAYDGSIDEIRAAVDAAHASDAGVEERATARRALASLARLSKTAAAARTEMDAAVETLKTSGEDYNENVLAGMVMFVEAVDDELRAERAKLSARVPRN